MKQDLWLELKHLFETDDGTLPDIWVENISTEEIYAIYTYVMTVAEVESESTVWDEQQDKEIKLSSLEDPVQFLLENKEASFKQYLPKIIVESVVILDLSIEVTNEYVAFDYRMGDAWNKKRVEALFYFLSEIKKIAQDSDIYHTHEGDFEEPSKAFENAFKTYLNKQT